MKILNQIKENLNQFIYYAEDYNKCNVLKKTFKVGKIREKTKIIMGSFQGHIRLIENLANQHNIQIMY